MRFFSVGMLSVRKNEFEISPQFNLGPADDFMVRGGAFYAIWDERTGLWSENEYDVSRIVDEELWAKYNEVKDQVQGPIVVKTMRDFSSGSWEKYRRYVMKCPDNYTVLDSTLIFADTPTTKEDYCSHKLPYVLSYNEPQAWSELINTLYDPLERRKIEWAIGAVLAGDGKRIQKFLVFYGDAGTGKSTILNVIQKIFEGYYCTFDARALATIANQFSLEVFKMNPLVAIQHDGDLSRIEDNSRLNSIIAHEEMTINEKHKSLYSMRMQAFLFMATNKPVKITDAKSGLIRRLIDINPSGRLIEPNRYQEIMSQIDFEIGAIASRCLNVYKKMGFHFYDGYRSTEMMYKTDIFYNFVDENYFIFSESDGVSLKQAYALYKDFCEETSLSFIMQRHQFREELKNYFRNFQDRAKIDGVDVRSYYSGFISEKFSYAENTTDYETANKNATEMVSGWLNLTSTESLIDICYKDCLAQYATDDGRPLVKWDNCNTVLSDIDTTKVHYVQIPENHIVIDFDIRDPETGEKSAEMNIAMASKFPRTYAEFSKSGGGLHLHYIYDGDSSRLSRLYATGIEVKVFSGNSSLRRRLSFCNDIPISVISGGLPLKEQKVVDTKGIQSEKGLRSLILRNLRKEIHPATKPSIDFIYKILDEAYESGLSYNVTDLQPKILSFAANSTNQAPYCLKTVEQMRFCSKDYIEQNAVEESMDRHVEIEHGLSEDAPIVFFDIEVFPNLLLVNYKADGENMPMHRLINPSPIDIQKMFDMKLVGYNNRRYDNHILYGRWLGKSINGIYKQSKALISGTEAEKKAATYAEAYNVSYTDVYDFASAGNKMSLKKAEIEMGIHHLELGMDWNKPVPEDKWVTVSEYCDNDVLATEARFHWLKADWAARQILSDLTGMSVNDSTNSLSTRFIFGKNRNPQKDFNYRDLSKPVRREDISNEMYEFLKESCPPEMLEWEDSILPYFPGYKFEWTKKTVAGKSINVPVSTYKGVKVGEGGYVYAEKGMYTNVALLDITSMHSTTMVSECLFGPFHTRRFRDVYRSRVAIKHQSREMICSLLDGKLTKYLDRIDSGEITYGDLAGAMKTVINSIYGLTKTSYDNPFRDPRNIDNLVAKRGALFMVDLKEAVQQKGYTVAHIKTDSIKIPNATPEIIQFVIDFGKRYGYNFEHEATYERMCLVNKSVYIAKYADGPHKFRLSTGEVIETPWTATGSQFKQPYVFKTLFAKAPVIFDDMCETKNCKTAFYLDMNEGLPPHSYSDEEYNAEIERVIKNAIEKNKIKLANGTSQDEVIAKAIEKYKGPSPGDLVEPHNFIFVGRAGQFTPVKPGHGGGELVREQDGKMVSATDSDGYRWLESETIRKLSLEDDIDISFYRKKVDEAYESIGEYCDPEWFTSDDGVPQATKIAVP